MDGVAPTPEALLHEADFVQALARRLVYDPDRAADVAQEAWVSALRTHPARVRSLRGWLAAVVQNVARHMGRGESRRRAREQAAPPRPPVPTPAEVASREETRRLVVEAVLALEPTYRDVVLLRDYEGLPPREIAARLGLTPGAVSTRLTRAHAMLRERLDRAHGGDGRAWALALGALLGGGAEAAAAGAAAGTGGVGIFGLVAAGVAGAVLVGAAGLWAWPRAWHGTPEALPLGADAPAAARTDARVDAGHATGGAHATGARPAAGGRSSGVQLAPGEGAVEPSPNNPDAPAAPTPAGGAARYVLSGRVLGLRRDQVPACTLRIEAGQMFADFEDAEPPAAEAAKKAAGDNAEKVVADDGDEGFGEGEPGLWDAPSIEVALAPDGGFRVDVTPLFADGPPGALHVKARHPDCLPTDLGVSVEIPTVPEPGSGEHAELLEELVDAGEDGELSFGEAYPSLQLALTITGPGVWPLDVPLRPVAHIEGRVVGDDGAPLAGVAVGACAPPDPGRSPRFLAHGQTDAEGRYRIRVAAGSPVWLVAVSAQHRPASLSLATPARRETVADLRLAPGDTIEGVVRLPDGGPCPGAEVVATPSGARPIRWFPGVSIWWHEEEFLSGGSMARADAEGRFRIDGLSRGVHHLQASAGGMFIVWRRADVDVPVAASITFELPLATLRVAVTAGGRPVADAALELTLLRGPEINKELQATGAYHVRARTDADGRFAPGWVQPGEYRLAVTAEGFLPAAVTLGPIAAADDRVEQVELRPAGG